MIPSTEAARMMATLNATLDEASGWPLASLCSVRNPK